MFAFIIFFVLGLACIYAEFFFSVVIISLIGVIFLILSLLFFGLKVPILSYIIITAIFELLALFTTIKIALWQVRRKRITEKD